METPKCVAKRDSGVGSLGAQDCGCGQTLETESVLNLWRGR